VRGFRTRRRRDATMELGERANCQAEAGGLITGRPAPPLFRR
jgi:hypothetical protein